MGSTALGLSESVFTITNSLIVSNDGLGISSDEVPVEGTMMNVTIAGNGNGGIYLTGGGVRVTNSILWGSGGLDYYCSGDCTVAYSDIQGGWTGTGNIDADPLFVDAAGGDYHLKTASPCRNKGTPIGAPTHDIEGTPRDAVPDMGAYEWTGFSIFLPVLLRGFAS
jgi:hypothetical protein